MCDLYMFHLLVLAKPLEVPPLKMATIVTVRHPIYVGAVSTAFQLWLLASGSR